MGTSVFFFNKEKIMALRDQLEAAKKGKQVEAEQSEAAEQAQLEQERQEKEADFQQSFAKRNTLKQALEDLQEAKGNLKQAWGKRKGELKNLIGLVSEIKQANPDATLPTLKEAVVEPEEGSDEEKYVDAKTGVEEAVSQVRDKKEALGGLGVEASGLDEQNLQDTVERAYKENDQAVREYVRQNPDSALPEVAEVRQEIVGEEKRDLQKTITGHSLAGSLNKGVRAFRQQWTQFSGRQDKAELDRMFERLGRHHQERQAQREESPEKFLTAKSDIERIQTSLTENILSNVAQSQSFRGHLEMIARSAQEDSVSVQAVSEVFQEAILNYKQDQGRKIESQDGIYTYETTGENGMEEPVDFLEKMYKALHGEEIPEEHHWSREDGGTLKASAGPLLASVLDQAVIREFAENVIVLAKKRQKLEGWSRQVESVKREEKDSQGEVDKIQKEVTRLTESIERNNKDIVRIRERIASLRQEIANLSLIRTEFPDDEAIGFARNGVLVFRHDTEQEASLRSETEAALQAAESDATEKRGAYSTARNTKAALLDFGGKKKAAAETEARQAHEVAEGNVENVKKENRTKWESLNANTYGARIRGKIPQDFRENIPRNATTWGEYIDEVKKALEAKITQEETEITRLTSNVEERTVDSETAQADLDKAQATLKSKQEAIDQYSDDNRRVLEREVADLDSKLKRERS